MSYLQGVYVGGVIGLFPAADYTGMGGIGLGLQAALDAMPDKNEKIYVHGM